MSLMTYPWWWMIWLWSIVECQFCWSFWSLYYFHPSLKLMVKGQEKDREVFKFILVDGKVSLHLDDFWGKNIWCVVWKPIYILWLLPWWWWLPSNATTPAVAPKLIESCGCLYPIFRVVDVSWLVKHFWENFVKILVVKTSDSWHTPMQEVKLINFLLLKYNTMHWVHWMFWYSAKCPIAPCFWKIKACKVKSFKKYS